MTQIWMGEFNRFAFRKVAKLLANSKLKHDSDLVLGLSECDCVRYDIFNAIMDMYRKYIELRNALGRMDKEE